MGHLKFTRQVDAPRSVVWAGITDHDLYAQAAPNLVSVDVVDGAEDTLIRRCVDTDGNVWTEACTTWEEGECFAVAVDVASSDFHRRLFNRFEGTWGIRDTAAGLEIVMEFDWDAKYGPFGRLISVIFAYKAPGLVTSIFDRWEAEIAARTEAGTADQTTPDA